MHVATVEVLTGLRVDDRVDHHRSVAVRLSGGALRRMQATREFEFALVCSRAATASVATVATSEPRSGQRMTGEST